MARRTRSSLMSAETTMAALTDSDHHDQPSDTADEAIGVDFSGQLLTPENSRSETSSTNEMASGEEKEKPVVRRRSTRVTRGSLRGLEQLHEAREDNQTNASESSVEPKGRSVSGETLVNIIAEGNESRSSSSIAAMENSWSQTTLQDGADGAENDELARCDTPASKESQVSTEQSSRRRSLRERSAKTEKDDKDEKDEKEQKEQKQQKTAAQKDKSENAKPLRRSSRLSLLSKATGIVDKATSVLGKRSREAMEKSKEVLNRRASLRPRRSLPAKEEPSVSAAPAAKKRRVSESDLPSKKNATKESPAKEEEQKSTAVVPRYKPKRWLTHGLYTGQDRYMDPRLNEAKNKLKSAKRNLPVEPQRKILPMPMFAGERLLKNGRDFKLPFDIFSPLPPGQPKPDEWKKVNKNVFVGDAANFWKENKPVELSTCTCTEETGCDENCQNRYMFYECDETNCRLGPNCGNRSFEELKQRIKAGGKYNIGVEVIKTPDRGYGVRSNRSFEPNQIIVEYTGEIITQKECERRMKTVYKNNECYYLMYFDQNMIIDATRGSIARFVNHSCEPNCRMEKWTVAGKPRMALFAGERGIMTGEELTYDYNFDPFSSKNVQECRCGAPTCRGVLGPRPKEQRSKEAKSDDKKNSKAQNKKGSKFKSKSSLAGTKRKTESVLDESTSRLNKKRKMLTAKSVKTGIKKAVTKAISGKKGVTTKKASITKTKMKAKVGAAAKAGTTKAAAKAGEKTISKSKTKTAAVKVSSKSKAKPKVSKATVKSKSSKVTTTTGKATAKSLTASEKVKTKLKATARRSTSFKKLKKPVTAKSPGKASNSAEKKEKGTAKSPARGVSASVKGTPKAAAVQADAVKDASSEQ
ncbi:hypothetical protein VTN77DRAFT_7824 [Rasamsonia byssochlamydoides]|uniref:uncharacterized protein n=1 Tax=Rasamsonia byssochlamydoides TaxID=89139 RepID=UPI0037423EF3